MNKFFRSKYSLLFLVILIAFFIIFKNSNKNLPFENSLHSSTNGLFRVFYSAGYWFSDKFTFLVSIGSLKKENEEFSKENLKLKGEIAQLKNISIENEKLRKELEIAPREDYNMEAAFIVGQNVIGNPEILYINKGSKSGIEEGMAVVAEKGVFIGKIRKVFSNQSEVELILSQSQNINCQIQKNSEKGIVHGEYGTSVILDLVPQTVQLEKNDTVVTSNLNEKIPEGLLVGYVKEITPSSDQLFQKASLLLPVNLDKLKLVWIIK